MSRRLTYPQDPRSLALFVAGLRSAAGGDDRDKFGRALRASLAADKVDELVVERLLRNVEAVDLRTRQAVLGELDDRSLLKRIRLPGADPRTRRGSTALFDTISRTERFEGPVVVAEDPNAPPVELLNWYRVRYNGFHCDAERGDPGWSDEVYLITAGADIGRDGSRNLRMEHHPHGSTEYGNVDVGDTRLGPVATCWQGLVPMSLYAVAFEHDYGDPDYYKDDIEAAVFVALAIAAWQSGFIDDLNELTDLKRIWILTAAAGLIAAGINWFLDTDDDQTDKARSFALSLDTMASFGRPDRPRRAYHYHEWHNPWMSDTWLERTDLQYDFRTRHSGGGGRYTFGYQIERDPPFPPREEDVD